MDMLRLLRQAIDYIEDNLHTTIEIDDIAKAAVTSKYHFQRMFHALTGLTVTEYVRNRRLTLAAEELAGTNSKVIDVAFKYSYEKNGTHDRINEVAGRPSGILLFGYYFDFCEDGTKRYLKGTELSEGNELPQGFRVLNISAQTYAVFESREKITEDVEIGLEIQNVLETYLFGVVSFNEF